MARFSRLHVLNTMVETGLVPIFYNGDLEVAKNIVSACKAGGSCVVEYTNRGDFAYQTFTALAQHFAKADPDIVLGVGSIIDAPTAAMFIASGANYIVSPILNPEVARLCNRHKVAYLPGCSTPSEISQAEELGVEIVKLFPGHPTDGPRFMKSILGPTPWTLIMPTGCVDYDEANVSAWIKAGCPCVGMGSKLVTKELMAARDYAEITRKVAEVLGWIKKARG
jgi:2-dehydro-3-deoxyphosphogluconate aldolase/(4S)-4-hydroxy-2-oxoglutarate aldolase